eukprot:gene4970-53899_t
MDRVSVAGVRLTERNVHRLLLAALLLATKWATDRPYSMSVYARVGGVRRDELATLETQFITDLSWDIH